ncbi:MAG TPA: PepSY-associated TM helix domain-containing protein [Ohtaekwangia sp.]|uniref:PepSY-associated TM helix domain-containing protein n=1 Tax=Ohtaekwangia sp. TaxID=2066019 RepID=UPI002F91DD67
MTFKKVIGKLHLWLGLTSGLVVFIIAVTGCIYAFQVEIQDMTQPYRFVEIQDKAVLPPSQLKAIAEYELPGKKIHAVLYDKPGKSAQVIFYSFESEYYYFVYLNPYTGEVLKVKDENADFFRIVLMGHFYLWLPPSIGQPVVASATLIFVAMLISGIILWWPKNQAAAKQRFSIKWSARWRRKNYDLHNVLGFYATWIAIILATTGLVWGFQWFAKGFYTLAGGEKSLLYIEPTSDTAAIAQAGMPAIDRIWLQMKSQHPEAEILEVHIPETKTSPIAVTVNADARTYWQSDYRFFDQYTLKELSVDHIYGRLGDAAGADKLLRMNYDIHVGAILGLPGKILAFMASLLCASLPVTGVCIWWGRRKKQADELDEEPQREKKTHRSSVAFAKPVIRPRREKV